MNGYVFERQPLPESPALSHTPQAFLGTRTIKPLSRTASSQNLRNQSNTTQVAAQQSSIQDAKKAGINGTDNQISSSGNGTTQQQKSQLRHFHISRASTQDNEKQPRQRKDVPAIVFIERKVRPKQDPTKQNGGAVSTDSGAAPSRPQKKPGKNARTPVQQSTPLKVETSSIEHPTTAPNTTTTPTPVRSAHIPDAFKNRWNVTSDELAKEMEAYTLQEIGHRLDQQQPPKTTEYPPNTTPGRGHSKFKPKAPAQRYAQRHPEEAILAEDAMDVDYASEEEVTDDLEYVTDTYYRVPIDELESTVVNIGLLIIDSQPDVDQFYGQDEDSDDEDEFDDEDENGKTNNLSYGIHILTSGTAENHYSADYPDEEIDSDDEYGRNVYNYRNHASDDEFDAAYSDSDDENNKKYAWKNRAHVDPLQDLYG